MRKRSRRGPVPTRIPPPILGKIPFPPPSRLCKLILVVVPALCSFYKNFPACIELEEEDDDVVTDSEDYDSRIFYYKKT